MEHTFPLAGNGDGNSIKVCEENVRLVTLLSHIANLYKPTKIRYENSAKETFPARSSVELTFVRIIVRIVCTALYMITNII